MSCVYLISEGDSGPVKVGVADKPSQRMRELQVGNPKRLSLIDWWKFSTRSEAFAIERIVLQENERFRLVGEWIRDEPYGLSSQVLSLIEERYRI